MGDAYWRYGDGRQQAATLPQVAKRPRSDFEMPSAHDVPSYYARDEDRAGPRVIRDTESVNASYERYLRSSPGGDPLVLCFVDFESPAHAATAMDALQGYKFDEHDRDSAHLRLQFARYPGARSGAGIVGNVEIVI
ncbi:UNVERIFIED_CONTAM: RNA-binding protein 1 [Sesamum calycinum]|uniref:RNA-binding protein 1 n=1 Tax=Sesamum calycinum TaxID=2727403 RepID=A0AAW2LSS8_9LAMI